MAIEVWCIINGRILKRSWMDASKPRFLYVVFQSDFPVPNMSRAVPANVKSADFDMYEYAASHPLSEFVSAIVAAAGEPEAEYHVQANISKDPSKGLHSHRFRPVPIHKFVQVVDKWKKDSVKPVEYKETQVKNTGNVQALTPKYAAQFSSSSSDDRHSYAYFFLPHLYASTFATPLSPTVLPPRRAGHEVTNPTAVLVESSKRWMNPTTVAAKLQKAAAKQGDATAKKASSKKASTKAVKAAKPKGKGRGKKGKAVSEAELKEDTDGMDEKEDPAPAPDGWDKTFGADGMDEKKVPADAKGIDACVYDQFDANVSDMVYTCYPSVNSSTCYRPPRAFTSPDVRLSPFTVAKEPLHNPAAISNTTVETIQRLILSSKAMDGEVLGVAPMFPWVRDLIIYTTDDGDMHPDVHLIAGVPGFHCLAGVESGCYNSSLTHFLYMISESVHGCPPGASDDFFTRALAVIGTTTDAAFHHMDRRTFAPTRKTKGSNWSAFEAFVTYVVYLQCSSVFPHERDALSVAEFINTNYLVAQAPNHPDPEAYPGGQDGDAFEAARLTCRSDWQLTTIEMMRIGERVFYAWLAEGVNTTTPGVFDNIEANYQSRFDGYSPLTASLEPLHGLFTQAGIQAFFKKENFVITNVNGGGDAGTAKLIAAVVTACVEGRLPAESDLGDLTGATSWTVSYRGLTKLIHGHGEVTRYLTTSMAAAVCLCTDFVSFGLTPAMILCQAWFHDHDSVIRYEPASLHKAALKWGECQTISPSDLTLKFIGDFISATDSLLAARRVAMPSDSVSELWRQIISELRSHTVHLPPGSTSILQLAVQLTQDPIESINLMGEMATLHEMPSSPMIMPPGMNMLEVTVSEQIQAWITTTSKAPISGTRTLYDFESVLREQAERIAMNPSRQPNIYGGAGFSPIPTLAKIVAGLSTATHRVNGPKKHIVDFLGRWKLDSALHGATSKAVLEYIQSSSAARHPPLKQLVAPKAADFDSAAIQGARGKLPVRDVRMSSGSGSGSGSGARFVSVTTPPVLPAPDAVVAPVPVVVVHEPLPPQALVAKTPPKTALVVVPRRPASPARIVTPVKPKVVVVVVPKTEPEHEQPKTPMNTDDDPTADDASSNIFATIDTEHETDGASLEELSKKINAAAATHTSPPDQRPRDPRRRSPAPKARPLAQRDRLNSKRSRSRSHSPRSSKRSRSGSSPDHSRERKDRLERDRRDREDKDRKDRERERERERDREDKERKERERERRDRERQAESDRQEAQAKAARVEKERLEQVRIDDAAHARRERLEQDRKNAAEKARLAEVARLKEQERLELIDKERKIREAKEAKEASDAAEENRLAQIKEKTIRDAKIQQEIEDLQKKKASPPKRAGMSMFRPASRTATTPGAAALFKTNTDVRAVLLGKPKSGKDTKE